MTRFTKVRGRRVAGLLPAVLAVMLAGSPAAAHDFWIQPAAFCTGSDAVTPFTLQVGHGPDRQRSAIPVSRITRLEAIGPRGAAVDLRGQLHLGGEGADGAFAPAQAGTHVLALETDHRAQSHLPAGRFNAYLLEEGLTPALVWRERAGRSDSEGSENYGRVAKALVQVGTAAEGAPDRALHPVGLTLEIVPELNPYAASRPPSLPFRVFHQGAPLAGALVKLTDLDDDAHPRASQVTDGEGRVVFVIPRTGQWRLNVVWTRPLPADRETGFETTFSSLTFGCRKEPADGP